MPFWRAFSHFQVTPLQSGPGDSWASLRDHVPGTWALCKEQKYGQVTSNKQDTWGSEGNRILISSSARTLGVWRGLWRTGEVFWSKYFVFPSVLPLCSPIKGSQPFSASSSTCYCCPLHFLLTFPSGFSCHMAPVSSSLLQPRSFCFPACFTQLSFSLPASQLKLSVPQGGDLMVWKSLNMTCCQLNEFLYAVSEIFDTNWLSNNSVQLWH